jgi:hypothetical protein
MSFCSTNRPQRLLFTTLHFLGTYELAQLVGVNYTGVERLDRDKHSSLLCRFVSYEEN